MPVEPLRLATFNIRHGRGPDGLVDLDRTARAIGETGAGLVALQEVDRNMARSGRVDQPGELARLTGMDVAFFPVLSKGGGQYGLALVSAARFEGRLQLLPRRGEEEPRGVVIGRWEGLSVLATHLSTRRAARARQTQRLAALASEQSAPVVVLGDLNQTRRSLGPLRERGFDPGPRLWRTHLGRWPRQIDFVLAGPGTRLERVHAGGRVASDHLAVVADITLA